MSGFAGILRERVVLQRRTAGRDVLAAQEEDWTILDVVWASARPEGIGAVTEGEAAAALPRWRVTLRPCAVAVGDRIERVTNAIDVERVIRDPALPDRVVAIGGEAR